MNMNMNMNMKPQMLQQQQQQQNFLPQQDYNSQMFNAPSVLKRQASAQALNKSNYPLTRWCAVYINTNANNDEQKSNDNKILFSALPDDSTLITPISHPDINLNMYLENEVIEEYKIKK